MSDTKESTYHITAIIPHTSIEQYVWHVPAKDFGWDDAGALWVKEGKSCISIHPSNYDINIKDN